jgi:chromosome segregation ATPase
MTDDRDPAPARRTPGSGEWARAKARDEALATQLDRIEGLVREQGVELRDLDRQLGRVCVTLDTLTTRLEEEREARRRQYEAHDALAHRVTALETRGKVETAAIDRAQKAVTPRQAGVWGTVIAVVSAALAAIAQALTGAGQQ